MMTLSTTPAPKEHRIRIVLADDSEVTLKSLSAFLHIHAELWVVGLARDGKAAIEQVELFRPDLVLMDIQMPVLNGFDATEELRARFPDLPVVLISATEGESWQQAAEAAGAAEFIPKRELAVRLPNLLQRLFGISRHGQTIE